MLNHAAFWLLRQFGIQPVNEAELVGEGCGPTAEVSTVSGFVTQRLGRFPRAGDALALGAWELRVAELTGTRVARTKLTRRAKGVTEAAPQTRPADAPLAKFRSTEQSQFVSLPR
jgi:hypothetical protein